MKNNVAGVEASVIDEFEASGQNTNEIPGPFTINGTRIPPSKRLCLPPNMRIIPVGVFGREFVID